MLHRDDTGIEHAELDRKLALFVGDDGKSELGNALRSLDVLNPPLQQRAVRFRTCAGDLLQAACTPVLSWWDDVSLQERAMVLTPRLANSGCILATDPSSVVHTGVKSLGWENRTAQLLRFLSRTHTHKYTHTQTLHRSLIVQKDAASTAQLRGECVSRAAAGSPRKEGKSSRIMQVLRVPTKSARPRRLGGDLSPIHSWNLMGPIEVSASKSGTTSPRLIDPGMAKLS